jgi:dihydropteroate synthase
VERRGVDPQKIIIDPGVGFGKSTEDNLRIIKYLREFKVLKKPVLIGTSRKSFIGNVLGLKVEDREEGTAATVAVSVMNGANIVRVHNVMLAKRVSRMVDAIKNVN